MVKKGKMTVESVISTDEQGRLVVIPDRKVISQIIADAFSRLEDEGGNRLLLREHTVQDRETGQAFTARRGSDLPPGYQTYPIEYLSIIAFRNGRKTNMIRLSANIREPDRSPHLMLGVTLDQEGVVESGSIIVGDGMRLNFKQTREGPQAVEFYREEWLTDARDILETNLPRVFERLADLARLV